MNEQENKNTAYFLNLVISLSQSALVSMGKVSNPMTGKIEKNMDLASANIDMLQMIKDKTEGNLNKEESQLINETLANMQLTFADELKNPSTALEDESAAGTEEAPSEPETEEKEDAAAAEEQAGETEEENKE